MKMTKSHMLWFRHNSKKSSDYFDSQNAPWHRDSTYYRGVIDVGLNKYDCYEICSRQFEDMKEYISVKMIPHSDVTISFDIPHNLE